MAEFVSRNDTGGAVGQPRRGCTQEDHERQAVKAGTPQQDAHHDGNEHGVKVDDDVVGPSFLKGFGVAGLTQHDFDKRVDAEEQHQRERHPRTTHDEARSCDDRGQQAPEMGQPRPAIAHQLPSRTRDL